MMNTPPSCGENPNLRVVKALPSRCDDSQSWGSFAVHDGLDPDLGFGEDCSAKGDYSARGGSGGREVTLPEKKINNNNNFGFSACSLVSIGFH